MIDISSTFANPWNTNNKQEFKFESNVTVLKADHKQPFSKDNRSLFEEIRLLEKKEEEDSKRKSLKHSFSLTNNTEFLLCFWLDYPQIVQKQQTFLMNKSAIFLLNCSFLI